MKQKNIIYIKEKIINILKQSYDDVKSDSGYEDNGNTIVYTISIDNFYMYDINLYFSNSFASNDYYFFPYDYVYLYSKKENIILNWENAKYKDEETQYERRILLNPTISDDEFCQIICNFFLN